MTELTEEMKTLELQEQIFKDVKFYVSGQVNDKTLELLKSGGAERMNYFSDYVTHLICGENCEDTDLSDATEIYEIPALTEKWIFLSAQLKSLVNTKPYIYNINKLFSNLTFCLTKCAKDRANLWAIITYHGGKVQLNFNKSVTHLISTNVESEMTKKAMSVGITVVSPDWIVESVKSKSLVDVTLFHPKLILYPKIVKRPDTTSITGFEPETVEAEVSTSTAESNQALLDKLKQRMPWNLPPPNVVTPSYAAQKTEQRLFSPTNPALPYSSPSQVPRSVVHHTPQSTQQQQQQQQPPQQYQTSGGPNFNRILEHLQKPNMQGINRLNPQQMLQNIRQKGPPNQIIGQQGMVNRQIVGGNAQMLQQGQKMQLLHGQQRILIQNPQNIALHKQQILQQSLEHQQILQHQNQLISVGQIGQQGQNQQIIQGQQILQQNPHTQQNQQILQQNQQGQQILQQNQQGQQILQQSQQAQQMLQQNQQGQQILQQNQQGQPVLQGQQILQTQQGQQILQQNQQGQQILQQNQGQQILQQNQGQQNQQGQQILQQNQGQQILQHTQGQQILQQTQGQQQILQNPQQQQLNQQLIQGQQQNQQLLQGPQNQQIIQNQPSQLIQGQQQQNQMIQGQQQSQVSQQQIIQGQQQTQQQIIQQNLQGQNQQQIIQQNIQGQQNSQQIIQQNLQGQQNPSHIIQQNLQGQQNPQQIIQQNAQGQQILQGQIIQGQGQQNLQQTQLLQQNRLQNIQQQNLLKQQQILGQHIVVQNQGNQQQGQILNQGQIINQQHIVNQKFAGLGPNKIVQFGQQGQQIIVSSQNQFFNQQQPPQLVQTNQGQFVQQQQPQQPGANLQIINHQQLINQQLQKQGGQHLLVNQQGNAPQFQQPGQNPQARPPVWQQQLNIRHPGGVNIVQQQGTRVQWAGGNQPQQVVQRQFIQLDQETHQKLQQMAPEERALFVQKLQKRRQQQQLQQRGGQIVIRTPAGINPQQHMQWLQQQGLVLQPNIQQQIAQPQQQQQQPQQPPQPPPTPNIQQQQQHTPGLSPIQQQQQQQPPPQQALAEHQRQQQLRLQQLQMPQPVQKTLQGGPQVQVIRTQPADPNLSQTIDNNAQNTLVNAKTKTALANMLNIRLQSGGSAVGPGSEAITEHSAAGTLRLMTQQHNAALNSNNNRAQEILALQQKRVIAAPNNEIIRPPVAVPQSPQTEPPKLQYSPRSVLPIQHRPGTFYGHNPNLRLPPDLFLLGCIFVVVELERFLDESMPNWRKKIEKHGGEIEKQYCSRVTHVLCETQRHGVVMQALRDYKRCVTLYWLSDVINRRQVLPPWTALHLPTMYLDTVPASKHLISLTGFSGTERDRVKHMIKYIGATLTTYFSKHNTLLIATKAEGSKYVHAKKWGIPVVNVQWLTDVMLGNFTALNQTEHIKYQQFSTTVNFFFDPSLVPNLMHAWKMPINITQDSYESLKRNASPGLNPPKAKKMKTEHVIDENENVENLPQSMTHRILFSRCSDLKDYRSQLSQMGGSIAKTPSEATHLVLPQLVRTQKLLHCICLGTKIVSESWLRDSIASKTFLPECNYTLDTKDFNSKYKCDFEQTMSTRNRFRLLDGKFFFITPSIFPSKKCITEIIQACGGIVERTRRTLSQIEATNVNSPYSYIILTHEQDLHLVADLLKKKDKVRIVCNVELILSAVLKQTFEVEPYVVKVV